LNSGGKGKEREVAVLQRLGVGVLGLIVLAFLALNVLAWSGGLVDEDSAVPHARER
jgi:hypothetical protein